MFPEFKPFFNSRLSATALYILAHYQTPQRIANMHARSYDPIRKLSRHRFTMDDFVQLRALARNTVEIPNDYPPFQMDILIALYSLLDSKVEEWNTKIKKCVREIDPPYLFFPTIRELSVSVILSRFEGFSKFHNTSKVLSFAGLEPSYFQSGQPEFTGHMVKHGSSRLRYSIMNCCLPIITNEPVFAEYYAKKRAKGKPYRVALTHAVKKLLWVIYTMQPNNIRYNPTMIC